MDGGPVIDPSYDGSSYIRPIIFTVLLTIGAAIVTGLSDFKDVSENWAKYRCRPQYIATAKLFGKDPEENFRFCANEVFKDEAGGVVGPMYKTMGSFVGVLSTLLANINSLRLAFTTMLGGIQNIFGDLTNRVSQFYFAIRVKLISMRSLMYRVYGTIFAMIYMILSGITAAQNFGDSTIGRFLDTFCFDPETAVPLADGRTVAIRTLKVGDQLAGDQRITAVFNFHAPGQPMVYLDNILVSTNHYVRHEGLWVQAGDHPDAKAAAPWPADKPLVCLNTSGHEIHIGRFVFSDYDETAAGDEATEAWAEGRLNGYLQGHHSPPRQWTEYGALLQPTLKVQTRRRGVLSAADLELGDELVGGGRIIGLVRKDFSEMTGAGITPSALVYHDGSWQRIGRILPVKHTKGEGVGVFVYPKSYITTASGLAVRDYIEVFSPDAEHAYTEALCA